jgi:hypothetical protein
MLARGGRPDLVARAWRPEEDAIVRDNYAALGATAVAALLPGRTVFAVQLRARRLGVNHVPRWTRSQDLTLEDRWESGQRLGAIARELGRTPRAVSLRARDLGLGIVAPAGYETLSAAVVRTGFNTSDQLRRVLRWAGVALHVSRSHAPRQIYRRHFVCPEDVDAAVAAWMRAESASEAARRVRCTRRTLLKRLARAGVEKGRGRSKYWRLDPADVDRAMRR